MQASVSKDSGLKGLASRLRKPQTLAGGWADIARAWRAPAQGGQTVTVRRRLDAAAAATPTAGTHALLLAATRLVLARCLPGDEARCLQLVDGSGGRVSAVPLAAPGLQQAGALLADCAGWLHHGARSIDGEPGVVLRLDHAEAPEAAAQAAQGPLLRLDFAVGADGRVELAAHARGPFEARLQDLLEHVEAVARQLAAAEAAAPLASVDPLSPAQRRRLLDDWGRADGDAPPGLLLPHVALAAQALRTPHAVALVQGRWTMSYGELDTRAGAVAHALAEQGVGSGDRVLVCADRGFEMVVGLCAVLKAGAAYVPVDPGYPADRVNFMIADCRPAAVLTTSASQARFAASGVPVLSIDAIADRADAPALLARETDADQPAYVIYTSGSTGEPKGAGVTRRGLGNLLHWYVQALSIDERDRVLVCTSFSFDLTQKNLLAPLCVGARVHLAAPAFDPAGVLADIEGGGVTVINLTPSYFQALAECDPGQAMASLRWAVLGGEPIKLAYLAPCASRYGGLRFLNSYGPTECSDVVASYAFAVTAADTAAVDPPVGRPLPGVRLYVLDGEDRLALPGAVGEIHVGGVAVGVGYVNQPGLTGQRFLSDPHDHTAGARIYRTGDLGRWRDDGQLEYLGRSDTQVKIRGHRVELGEIEARLARCPGVRMVAVGCPADAAGAAGIVAWLVGDAGGPPTEADLHAQLAAALPAFMLPAQYVFLAEMPLTPSGKIDRLALPSLQAKQVRDAAPELAATATEHTLLAVWQEIFQRDRIGVLDDFFAIGGHSLLATRLLGGIARRTGVTLSIADVFEHKTIRDQARRVDQLPAGGPAAGPLLSPLPELAEADREEIVL